jgi:hypothetical protein
MALSFPSMKVAILACLDFFLFGQYGAKLQVVKSRGGRCISGTARTMDALLPLYQLDRDVARIVQHPTT